MGKNENKDRTTAGQDLPPYNDVQREVGRLLEAGYVLLWISTDEERRAEAMLADVAEDAGYHVWSWDCASGVEPLTIGADLQADREVTSPADVYARIAARQRPEFWLLRDLHAWMPGRPAVSRGLKTLARSMEDTLARDPSRPGADRRGAVVVLTPTSTIPDDLRGVTHLVEWPLPSREELARVLTECATTFESSRREDEPDFALPEIDVAAVVESGVGLSVEDFNNAVALALFSDGAVSTAAISQSKREIIRRGGVLEWLEPDPRGLGGIGGLDGIKNWVVTAAVAHEPGAREYGLHPPRAVLFGGVPGCGKTSVIKALAAAMGWPLIRLDLGALRGSLVGDSEKAIRKATQLIDAIGQCVVLGDELEKALGGALGAAGDLTGVRSDALGHLLYWMQEHRDGPLLAFTSNDSSNLPPELLRRMDEMFFVDLPHAAERAAILRVTIEGEGRDVSGIDLDEVAEATEDFTGAEIADKLVPMGLSRSFRDGKREPVTEDLIVAAGRVTKLADSARERLDELRLWAKGRMTPASLPPAVEPVSIQRRSRRRNRPMGVVPKTPAGS